MMWITVRKSDGAAVGQPFTVKPAPTSVLDVVECPIGYPERMVWSAAARAFFDKPTRRYTFNEWVDLFPLAEQVAIAAATMTDPMAKLIYDRAQCASGDIDPTDPRTVEGLGYLVSKGYVAQATVDAIVSG